jgi:hypothetical protein
MKEVIEKQLANVIYDIEYHTKKLEEAKLLLVFYTASLKKLNEVDDEQTATK